MTTPPAVVPGAFSTLRAILRCAAVLLIVGAVGVGLAARSLWKQADQLLRAELERQLAERVPDWDIEFASAKADLNGVVRVTDLVLRDMQGQPLLAVPEILLEIDTDLLFEHQKVQVHSVKVRNPIAQIRCEEDGHWNFELPKPRPSNNPPPDISIQNATVLVQLDESARWPAAEFRMSRLSARATPNSRHSYSLSAQGDLENVGRIELAGSADLVHGVWSAAGRCERVNLEGLLRNLVGISPEARQRVTQIADAGRTARRPRPVQLAAAQMTGTVVDDVAPATGASNGLLSDIGLQADVSLEFAVGSPGRGQPPRYSLDVDIRDGQLTNRVLPIPLFGLKGQIALNNAGLVVKSLTAANGDSRFLVDGRWDYTGEAPRRQFIGKATELRIGRELRDYLPPILQKRFDELQPAGRFNLDVEYDAALGAIPLKLRGFTVADGSLRHDQFPYPVSGIQGTIRQNGSQFELAFYGEASGRKVVLNGSVDGVSPEAQVVLRIHVDELPIDPLFLQAFSDSRAEKVQKTYSVLQSLNPSGLANWTVELERPAGPGQKFHLNTVQGLISRANLSYTRFPYAITDASGVIRFERALDDTWHFRDLRGLHGATQISGNGSFALAPSRGLLLQLTALGVPLDADLQTATIAATSSFQTIWEELSPTGTLDLTNLQIAWSPLTSVKVVLPSIQFRDATITPAALPYRWEGLNGAARWADGRLVIHTLQGWHRYGSILESTDDSTNAYLNINGVDPSGASTSPLAYFEQPGDGGAAWRLHLADVQIRKLAIDDELRGALPTSLRTVAANLAPTRPLDVEFGLDLKGFGKRTDPVTASWRVRRAVLHGGDITLGIPIQNARGWVEMTEGSYDGKTALVAGTVHLDEATIYSLPFKQVRGPFLVRGNQIIVGTPSWVEIPRAHRASPLAGKPVEGQLYGGTLKVNALADLIPNNPNASQYTAEVKLADARLAEWARTNQQGMPLSGDVSGEVRLRGEGPSPTRIVGEGYIQIAKAQLFALPVFVKIFQLIQFQPAENTAFNYAYGEFKMHDGLFDFSRIELVGNAMAVVGRGTVGFAGEANQAIDIHLYTRVQNNLPVIGFLIEQVGRGWMGIHVLGTVSQPQAVTQARIPVLDDALKGFRQAIERGQPPQQPARVLR